VIGHEHEVALLSFESLYTDNTLHAWANWFKKVWPAYRAWYLREGVLARPTYFQCREALRLHMPEILPLWERLLTAVGGGDLEARFLSLYNPPGYQFSCSQAVWRGASPMLVRNYDYDAKLIDAVVVNSEWNMQQVIGSSDCLIGLVDGMNQHGLCLSLTFGGKSTVGDGFAMPMILRYVLQTCSNTAEAIAALSRIPSHMAYNITVLDGSGHVATVHVAPDKKALVTSSPVATNHQPDEMVGASRWRTATVERERFLLQRLSTEQETASQFVAHFLQPPLYSFAFSQGRGTLYTAVYQPDEQKLTYYWPKHSWSIFLGEKHSKRVTMTFPE